jgi:Flp pilus assembly protein CpaB
MRFRPAGGLDLAAGALILGGAGLLAVAIVATVLLLNPSQPAPTSEPPTAAPLASRASASAALAPDRVATVLSVDVTTGAGAVARSGDHVDILAYFPRQAAGGEATTRALVQDVPVLLVDRSGPAVSLTVGVTPDAALLLQESQALGARPFITLRPLQGGVDLPSTFSDTDLADRLTGSH